MKRIVVNRRKQFAAKLLKMCVVTDRNLDEYLKSGECNNNSRMGKRQYYNSIFNEALKSERNKKIEQGETIEILIPDDQYEFICVSNRQNTGKAMIIGDGTIVNGVLTHYFEIGVDGAQLGLPSIIIKEINDKTVETNLKDKKILLRRKYKTLYK